MVTPQSRPWKTYDLLDRARRAILCSHCSELFPHTAVERTADAGGDTPSSPPAESDTSTQEEKEV